MNFHQIEATVAAHYAPAIINGDVTGLDDREESQLDAFLESLTEGNAPGHFDIVCTEPTFTTCAVTHLQAECVTLVYFYPSRENQ